MINQEDNRIQEASPHILERISFFVILAIGAFLSDYYTNYALFCEVGLMPFAFLGIIQNNICTIKNSLIGLLISFSFSILIFNIMQPRLETCGNGCVATGMYKTPFFRANSEDNYVDKSQASTNL